MRTVDIGVGAFFVLLGLLGVSQSLQLDLYQRGGIPGPGMFPLLLSISLVVLGGLVVITRIRAKPDDFPPFAKPSRNESRRVVTVMASVPGPEPARGAHPPNDARAAGDARRERAVDVSWSRVPS